MSIFSFFTIRAPIEGIYKEKGSKFLAFAYPAQSEEEVKERLAALKKKYFDARHHCYAYLLGADKSKHRAYDDGEPNHSAGDPILGQIKSRNLTNVLVVVVRYFGGTKLGVSGLINAYKCAAKDALNQAQIIECEVLKNVKLVYEYASTSEMMRLIKEFDVQIVNQKFSDKCLLEGEIRLRDDLEFSKKIELMKTLGYSIELT